MTAALHDLTIRQAGEALRTGTLTSTALTEAVLARIEATEPAVNAYITVTAELAREQAAAADAELAAGHDRGPLRGIPFALKDLFDTAGIATTAGSGFLRDRVPAEDAFVVKRLQAAGVVLTGKLGLHEFAFGTTSTNAHFGAIRNPWNLDHVPGGSSGGSGAAIAAGSCLGTLGTDTGGSIRMPAALCGVAGVMPSTGRVSRGGVFPLSQTLDHAGPLARTAEDCALILNAIAGHDPDDPLSLDRPAPDCASELGRDLRGLRVGVTRDPLWLGAEEEVAAACETALEVLQVLGATIEMVELPLMAKTGRLRISASEAAAFHRDWLLQHPERYGEDVRSKIEFGVPVLATEYIEDQRLLRALTEETRQVLSSVDVLVSPTTPSTASRVEAGDPESRLARYTRMYNVTGIPAASIPCGFDARGLPIGLMIGGRHFDEVTVCRVAHAYEQATDWHTRRPALPNATAGGDA